MRHPSRRPGTDQRGFSLVELMTAVVIVAILTAMAVPAYSRIRQRFYDATALSDVVNAGKAVEGLDSQNNITVTVRGPGRIRPLPGAMVSKGTTIIVRRRVNQRGVVNYTVQGQHAKGTGATFFFQNARVYATGANL